MIFKIGTIKIARKESKEQRWHLQTFIRAMNVHICMCVCIRFLKQPVALEKYGKNHGCGKRMFCQKEEFGENIIH